MIELLPAFADHVVAMRANGRIDNDDLQVAIDAIETAKRAHPRVSLYAEMDNMRGMTATAMLRDIGYGLTQIGELSHYYRVAVVTDQRWIGQIVKLENRLFKTMQIRAFPTRDSEIARQWVTHLPDAPEPAMAAEST